ncbi:MAG: hypothetical protein KGZ58_01515, partial [Ignavibacteriales bacterium]|nr:hypothetical protein [Ignavibacteriales bacterium]
QKFVFPAKAGIQKPLKTNWIPSFDGMTNRGGSNYHSASLSWGGKTFTTFKWLQPHICMG